MYVYEFERIIAPQLQYKHVFKKNKEHILCRFLKAVRINLLSGNNKLFEYSASVLEIAVYWKQLANGKLLIEFILFFFSTKSISKCKKKKKELSVL